MSFFKAVAVFILNWVVFPLASCTLKSSSRSIWEECSSLKVQLHHCWWTLRLRCSSPPWTDGLLSWVSSIAVFDKDSEKQWELHILSTLVTCYMGFFLMWWFGPCARQIVFLFKVWMYMFKDYLWRTELLQRMNESHFKATRPRCLEFNAQATDTETSSAWFEGGLAHTICGKLQWWMHYLKQKMNEILAHTAKKWLNCIYYQTTWVIEEMLCKLQRTFQEIHKQS